MRSQYKGMAAAIAAAVLIATLTGCATEATATSDDEPIACSQVTTDAIDEAKQSVVDAEKTLTDAKGSFDETDAQAAFDAAKAKVSTLETRATECEKEGDADGAGATATSKPEACGDARFEQVVVDRSASAKVDPRYDGEVRPIINDAALTAEQKIDAIKAAELKLAASNAQSLAFWAFGLGLYEDPNTWSNLVEGGKIVEGACLNEEGKMLYAKYEGALTAKGTTLAVGQADPNSTNSGVNGDTAVFDPNSGLTGDLVSIIITLPDGSKMEKLVRCGNLVFPSVPPTIPPGTTDEPGKNINDAPQRNGNVPTQQIPNPLPAREDHAQPTAPADPPSTYVPPPAAPAPEPAPVPAPGGGTIPAPAPEPSPIVTPPSEAPAGPPPSTCSPAPGRTCP